MKKILVKTASSLLSLVLFSTSLIMPANAEVVLQNDASGDVQSTFFINITPAECDEYKLYPNHFMIDPYDPLDTNGSRAFFADPSIKTCIEYNIYPNKYDIIPPRFVTGSLLLENNGYYKYFSDKGYNSGTLEVKPDVYPCKKGVCYDVIKRIDDDIFYLYLPLNAEDIPTAEAFIEADDREGLYDFLAAENAYEHPYYGEMNDFTSVVNRDYTPAFENSLWEVLNYTQDQIYQDIIDRFVYPTFQSPPTATASGGYTQTYSLDSLTVGDVNLDGKVSVFDVIKVNKMHVGIITTTNAIQTYLADVDESNKIDYNDVTTLMRMAVNIEE